MCHMFQYPFDLFFGSVGNFMALMDIIGYPTLITHVFFSAHIAVCIIYFHLLISLLVNKSSDCYAPHFPSYMSLQLKCYKMAPWRPRVFMCVCVCVLTRPWGGKREASYWLQVPVQQTLQAVDFSSLLQFFFLISSSTKHLFNNPISAFYELICT